MDDTRATRAGLALLDVKNTHCATQKAALIAVFSLLSNVDFLKTRPQIDWKTSVSLLFFLLSIAIDRAGDAWVPMERAHT